MNPNGNTTRAISAEMRSRGNQSVFQVITIFTCRTYGILNLRNRKPLSLWNAMHTFGTYSQCLLECSLLPDAWNTMQSSSFCCVVDVVGCIMLMCVVRPNWQPQWYTPLTKSFQGRTQMGKLCMSLFYYARPLLNLSHSMLPLSSHLCVFVFVWQLLHLIHILPLDMQRDGAGM